MKRAKGGVFIAAIIAAALTGCAAPMAASSDDGLVRLSPAIMPLAGSPLESVCQLRIRRALRPTGIIFGFSGRRVDFSSAVLIDNRYLLTAGHSIFEDTSSIHYIDVTCGVQDVQTVEPNERALGSQTLVASGFTGSEFSRDFGMIRLRDPITVSHPFRLAQETVGVGETVELAGYPGRPHSRNELFAATADVTQIDGSQAFYDILTHRSNSGGPVWRSTETGPELVAIHTRGNDVALSDFGGRIVDDAFRAEAERMKRALDEAAAGL